MKLILLEPIYKERIWGGHKIRDVFNYPIPSNKTGEAWTISAHKEGSSIIKNGAYQGQTLRHLFQERKDLFGNTALSEFPLLVKLIDANDDLSVQVHPDDAGARQYNDLGKTECWYVLDCKADTKLVFGHHAKNKEEFSSLVKQNKWDKLLNYQTVNPGDFLYVPAGKLHALSKGMFVLEIQQSSNTTFRVYDYDRMDKDGNKRDLHIKETIDASFIPDRQIKVQRLIKQIGKNRIERLVESPYFTVEKWHINETFHYENSSYVLASVLKGKGIIDGVSVEVGDHFIITSKMKDIEINGSLELMITYP